MQVGEVVNGPRRQKLGQRHRSEGWMRASAREILRLQVERLQRSDIAGPQAGEFVEELLQRFAPTLFELGRAIEGVEGPRLAVLEDDARAEYPVGALAHDQVAEDVEGAPGSLAFVDVRPGFGQST